MFDSPFTGNINRKITKAETIEAIRRDIAGELDAIFKYDAHIIATDEVAVKRVLTSIRDEEKVHVGELFALLEYLDPTEADLFKQGNQEAKTILDSLET